MPYDKENMGRKEMCQVMCWYVDIQSHKLYAAHWNVKLSKDILDKRKCVKTCVGIWMFNHTNYMLHIGMSNWVATYLTRRKQVLIVISLMFILLQDMK